MVHVYPEYDLPRDLEGFGESSFDPKWPNEARIAISFILNYEEGGERSVLYGDKHSEPYLWEKGVSAIYKEGARFVNAESEYEYGSRVGCWRVLRLFKEFGWNFTTYAIAVAMEKNPTFAKACVREGHEIAAHGYRWLEIWDYDKDADKKYIIKTLKTLKDVTGEMPVGCYWGRGTPNTKALFPEAWREAGAEMLYCSEAYNDDVPYWIDLPAEKDLPDSEKKGKPESFSDIRTSRAYKKNSQLVLDGKFYMNPGFVGSDMYEKYLKATFDMLYREGGKMMNIPLHSRIVGKPGRSEALRNFMKYIADKPGVWVTTRKEIATHFKTKFPYRPGRSK
ncbi:MAG: hypothetical protein M1834_001735 [Cirrosporium novae-zelandiae]|nr:MAG: hypothetical protein M1834_001735 [Cirrosporium novae-zelandiae]